MVKASSFFFGGGGGGFFKNFDKWKKKFIILKKPRSMRSRLVFFCWGGGRDLINTSGHGDNYVYHLRALSPHIAFMVFSMFI